MKNQKILSHTNHSTVRRNLTLEVQTLPVNPLSTTQRHDSRRKITTPTTKNRRTRSQSPARVFWRIIFEPCWPCDGGAEREASPMDRHHGGMARPSHPAWRVMRGGSNRLKKAKKRASGSSACKRFAIKADGLSAPKTMVARGSGNGRSAAMTVKWNDFFWMIFKIKTVEWT